MSLAQIQEPVNSAWSPEAQRSLILTHLMNRGPASAVMLSRLYGIGSPRKRLSEIRHSKRLEELGCTLEVQPTEGYNQFGKLVKYNLYYLKWNDEEGDRHAV